MSGPLDRIEAVAGSYRAAWIRVQGSDQEVHLAAGSFFVRDVLALVNVAKAAEAYVAAAQADDDAIDALLNARERNEEESLRDAQKVTREDVDDKYDALREALAALGKEPA